MDQEGRIIWKPIHQDQLHSLSSLDGADAEDAPPAADKVLQWVSQVLACSATCLAAAESDLQSDWSRHLDADQVNSC